MNLTASRVVLVLAGFALWALTSMLPVTEALREGWDRPAYWQIGLPLVFVLQAVVAIVSQERITFSPLWVLLGHAVAMLFIANGGSVGLLPLSVIFVGVPLYLMLLVAAFIGRMVRGRTGLAS